VGDGTSSMATAIRDVTGSELRLFGDIVARLERLGSESDARAVIFMDVMRLLRSEFGASYVWNPRKNRFDEAVSFNMERTNLRRYEEWYQFRDPLRGSPPVFPRPVYPDFACSFWMEDCLQ
jgi:hypothetical protein